MFDFGQSSQEPKRSQVNHLIVKSVSCMSHIGFGFKNDTMIKEPMVTIEILGGLKSNNRDNWDQNHSIRI